jgi:hypothetical protein
MRMRSEEKCGTVAGYNVHTKRQEKPCAYCREAQSAYVKEWRHRTKRSAAKLYSAEEIQTLITQAKAEALTEAVAAFPLETIHAPDNAVVWLMRRAETIKENIK